MTLFFTLVFFQMTFVLTTAHKIRENNDHNYYHSHTHGLHHTHTQINTYAYSLPSPHSHSHSYSPSLSSSSPSPSLPQHLITNRTRLPTYWAQVREVAAHETRNSAAFSRPPPMASRPGGTVDKMNK